MSPVSTSSLWDSVSGAGLAGCAQLSASDADVGLAELASGTALGAPLDTLRGRSALVWTTDQLGAALALIEIDGIVRRLVLCPPDFDPAQLPHVVATAEVDAIITDRPRSATADVGVERIVSCQGTICRGAAVDRTARCDTEWVLFTSGTTGVPKLVVHTLATLTAAIDSTGSLAGPLIWATCYDTRRYGGLQVLLRVALGGGSLVLSAPDGASTSFLERAKAHGVTHITGTPSHWRRALMSPVARSLAPKYARLSGEIVDQAIVDQLHATFPDAKVAHAFASTEAGVAFEVTDGQSGFPARFIARGRRDVDLEIEDDTLRVRSNRTALRYAGARAEPLLDAEGFVDTGDVVERRGDRYYFVGRRGGIINVGGLKIHPEEVEAVINRHPAVRMSRVTARKNPITGALVAAEIVLAPAIDDGVDTGAAESTKAEILAACRGALAAHKVPTSIRIVSSLAVTSSGKLERRDA